MLNMYGTFVFMAIASTLNLVDTININRNLFYLLNVKYINSSERNQY